jgi:hypothetical protein
MSVAVVCRLLTAAILLVSKPAAADPPSDEALPPPRPVAPPVIVLPAPPAYRVYSPPLSRDVWQLYDVGRTTYTWRPRVIVSPFGDYYQYNHAPYPWTQLYPHWYAGRLAN